MFIHLCDDVKVGYFPYSQQLNSPGDRRRFIFYANERKIKYTIANPEQQYDIVYLTYGCNLSEWINYKIKNPEVKIIFELIDSYILESISFTSLFRGIFKFITRKESKLWFLYKSALRKMISIADAIVCSTIAQKHAMLKYNNNVHLSLDYFSNDINFYKSSLISNGKLKLVWEGQAYTLKNLLLIANVLNILKNKIELYIITDPIINNPIRIFSRKSNNLLKTLKCNYTLINWKKSDFCYFISKCDLAIIPIPSSEAMMWNKPENKLLMFWEIGIPTLTSNTPAYDNVMNIAEVDYSCATLQEWISKIESYIDSSIDERNLNFSKSNIYIKNYHTKNQILNNWDLIFHSIYN